MGWKLNTRDFALWFIGKTGGQLFLFTSVFVLIIFAGLHGSTYFNDYHRMCKFGVQPCSHKHKLIFVLCVPMKTPDTLY